MLYGMYWLAWHFITIFVKRAQHLIALQALLTVKIAVVILNQENGVQAWKILVLIDPVLFVAEEMQQNH